MKLWYLLIALVILSLTSLFIGVKGISPLDLFSMTPEQWQIMSISRIPRLISILIAGFSMSIAGLIMQQLSRNKFVSPTTAGTDDAAKLGMVVSMLLFSATSTIVQMLIAFAFALAGTYLFMKFLGRLKFKDAIFIPLVGLMFGNVINSITTFYAYKHDLIQSLTAWLQGSFTSVMAGRYELLYISIPLLVVAYLYAGKFTIAGMGEDFATNLGLNHKFVVNVGLVIVALISVVVIVTIGTIPFLGLIIPNIVALYLGDNLKKTLVHTAVMGAVFLLACDVLGRIIIYPYEIPISLTVGVIGSVVFLFLLLRRRAYES
ncbi:ABC transporter permease [Paenibacillus sp. J5C_2022]|uniref:ABC transporter permease n=1 Tax=Paenibacillus sp. J5C2022 TaxID=2977129 RepID=UPI0021D3917B|nr:ABC transporter permease [Paenibacillus sp. J5C2022]MCU6712539.1 ABC transporter permease [Paenibacillus sp. J5C2022]